MFIVLLFLVLVMVETFPKENLSQETKAKSLDKPKRIVFNKSRSAFTKTARRSYDDE